MNTEAEINTRLASGDTKAYEDIFNLLYPRMLGYCKLFIKDNFKAEDLVQDCFVKLWNKRKTIKPDGNIEKFLFVMLRNHCLNFLRDNRINNYILELNDFHKNEIQQIYQLDFLEETEQSIEEKLNTLLLDAINNLPPRQKEIFVKAKIGGQNQKEVANELGINIKAVEKSITLSKRRIKDEISKRYPILIVIISLLFI